MTVRTRSASRRARADMEAADARHPVRAPRRPGCPPVERAPVGPAARADIWRRRTPAPSAPRLPAGGSERARRPVRAPRRGCPGGFRALRLNRARSAQPSALAQTYIEAADARHPVRAPRRPGCPPCPSERARRHPVRAAPPGCPPWPSERARRHPVRARAARLPTDGHGRFGSNTVVMAYFRPAAPIHTFAFPPPPSWRNST